MYVCISTHIRILIYVRRPLVVRGSSPEEIEPLERDGIISRLAPALARHRSLKAGKPNCTVFSFFRKCRGMRLFELHCIISFSFTCSEDDVKVRGTKRQITHALDGPFLLRHCFAHEGRPWKSSATTAAGKPLATA